MDVKSKTVLVIDDEVLILDMLSTLLKMLGHIVICAKNGKEGVELYRNQSQSIDLVILDMNMPIMSGCETFYGIKKINSCAKVLIASGYDTQHQTSKLLNDGAIGVLQKPYKIDELQTILSEHTS